MQEAPRKLTAGAVQRSRGRSGFTLLELLVTFVILLAALQMTVSTLVSVNRLAPVNRETARALEAARGALEELRGAPFDELFALYDADPANDPGGAGTAPGAGFAVATLEAVAADPDGLPGAIVFPTLAGELREDVVDDDLGMPRDLNGDGVEDALDHAADYAVLPVRVRVEWNGRNGERALELVSTITAP